MTRFWQTTRTPEPGHPDPSDAVAHSQLGDNELNDVIACLVSRWMTSLALTSTAAEVASVSTEARACEVLDRAAVEFHVYD